MEKSQNDAPALLNVREAAAWLRIGERKVYDLVAKDAIPHTRAGAKLLFSPDELTRWLAGKASGPRADAAGASTVAGREVTFMLRQPSAGARGLFERLIERDGVRRSSMRFHREEAMAGSDLAAAIQGGEADAGLAARAQARLAGLDFVPLVIERID